MAIDRHVGRRKPFYAREGLLYVQSGKDLTEIPTVIGTGGVFTYNPLAERIIASRTVDTGEALRPRDPRIVLDTHYVLYAVGLLSRTHPDIALRIFMRHFGSGSLPIPPVLENNEPQCECC